jgi:hypothetical protein
MSVDFRAGLAFGWLVSPEEHYDMVEFNPEFEDDFITINGYDADYKIFGIWLYCIEEGSVKEFNINDLANKIPADFMGEWGAKLRAMGKGAWFDEEQRLPGVFLVGQVT